MYSITEHNSKYGVCTHTCINGVWQELKNCCCGHDEDNDWYVCSGLSELPLCYEPNEGLVIYTNCYPRTL